MLQDSSPSEPSPGDKQVQKRTRILLSCAPCRNSKLKCDRQQPCSQCEKKGRMDQCVYAPRPVKKKPPAKNMTSRLKRLESLVREMMENEGDAKPPGRSSEGSAVPSLQGHVVKGEHGTTYVGATHCMAMLEDYARFWQDSNDVTLHWLAQLFMMLALGIFFNSFAAPHELSADSPVPILDRIKHYRSCAGWALIWGKYTQPTSTTLPAFLLYVESHFMFNRAAQMNCYVLSGVCIRLLLKMGLHRDPSKLANISPYEGEMRRRLWNMAVQIELIVSFHMGLPSMLQGIEADTRPPSNLQDEDFDEDSTSLPPARPATEYTHVTYTINKTKIIRVFGQIANQAHSLSPPEYTDVLRLDAVLQDTWGALPGFMRVRPLDECVGDAPVLLTQRFGLAALYNKCRCVLHRRYLAEPVPDKDHNYSRQQGIDAALSLLQNQYLIWRHSKPGNVLSSTSWFLSSLAVHDYLLAAMIVYLLIKNENYPDGEGFDFDGKKPSKEELKGMLKRSYMIWTEVSENVAELRKTADALAAMLSKLGDPVDKEVRIPTRGSEYPSSGSVGWSSSAAEKSTSTGEPDLLSSIWIEGLTSFPIAQPTTNATPAMDFPLPATSEAILGSNLGFDPSWMEPADNMDWRFLDVSLAHSHTAGTNSASGASWVEKLPLDELDMLDPGIWGRPSGEAHRHFPSR
ncbi:Transcription factor, fungi [Metarhizium guizhouense ARSEF 977]|uniref:Transcription factor, fungi n=1 Tax=Metarhizium guizhouense (strain ARSEF 977) TaxID=1276136 RepID=A0A0B4GJF6_METGA|nr:Transcription factor, fungi [Metarhizium guizhouense ARSEF 977]